MTPSDPSVVRRKLAVIVENVVALQPIGTMPPQRYREELFTSFPSPAPATLPIP